MRGRPRARQRIVTRAVAAASIGAALWLAAASTAAALPAKEYRVQESTLCMNWQGCPRMLRNAVSEAERFCRSEGGVQQGKLRRDFRCEQRGIYCVVTGRIECLGRMDPTKSSKDDGATSSGAARTRTCLDAGCQRFVSHAPGTEELGTHACPAGYWLAGVSGEGNNIVCQALPVRAVETRLERQNRRQGVLACPVPMVARGVNAARTVLLCERLEADVVEERPQDETGHLGLQVCTGDDGRFDAMRFVTGLDEARQQVLCADVAPR